MEFQYKGKSMETGQASKEEFRYSVWVWESVAGKTKAHAEFSFAGQVQSRTGSLN